MAKSKKVQMPIGIRNKLMAAVSMLLVSSIMMVSSTFAWFTLSTAPEVTGITTSVGANGNLEMALLTTETFAATNTIKSAVGDSSANTANNHKVTDANITWGNLVDLSDSSYGLTNISLMPAQVNGETTTTGEGENAVTKLTSVTMANPLKTPVYGADGRVNTLDANTVSAIYSGGAFTYGESQTYGVRAIGVTSDLSARQITFNSAKSAFNANAANASRAVVNAVNANADVFGPIALSPDSVTYDYETLVAVKAVAQGAKTSLESIVKAYANAALAKAASKDSGVLDDTVATLQSTLSSVISASTLQTILSQGGIDIYNTNLGDLATAQTNIGSILSALEGYITTAYGTDGSDGTPADNAEVKTNVIDPLIAPSTRTQDGTNYYLSGGVIGQYIAAETGNFELASALGNTAFAGAKDTTGALTTLAGTVAVLEAPDGAAESNITDFYGYVIDFAFRTNASGSSLQLQTTPKDRVYTDGAGATQGGGSKVTFTYDETTPVTAQQGETLLKAVRLVFLNPDNGTVFATAQLSNIAQSGDGKSATADVKLVGQSGDNGVITGLTQNDVQKVSVLVYLDGDNVDNTAVTNAASSGSLSLNLQFSSSADLQPMENTALKTMGVAPAASSETP